MLLHLTLLPTMMPSAMSEQTEPPERTANEPPEHLTFAEAAERLNITADAVRMRVHRGKLASIRVNERTFVLWPQPAVAEQPNEPRTERTGSERDADRSAVHDDARLEAARLQGELAEVRARRADAQADRDRWHASAPAAIERYNHDMQEMRGLLSREQVIALSASTTAVVEDAPATHQSGPHSAAVVAEASEITQPAWRRWWRRMTGGAVDLS
jgi:excisionase family DNA binding protein